MIKPRKPMGAYPTTIEEETSSAPQVLSFDDWQRVKTTFIAYGFSPEEAEWAANNDLDPYGPKADSIARILKNRHRLVATLMRISGESRRVTIEVCSKMRQENAERKGAEDTMNLFIGES